MAMDTCRRAQIYYVDGKLSGAQLNRLPLCSKFRLNLTMLGETCLTNAELRRSIARILIVGLLAGGLPLFSGVVVVGSPVPEFALDICHPLPSANRASPLLLVVPIPSNEFACSLPECGVIDELPHAFRSQLYDSPDPPPPRVFS